MSTKEFRELIEAGELTKLKDALEYTPGLANQSIEWFLNQINESDPLHYVSDCVFNGWLDDDKASEIAELLLQHGALIEGTEERESPLIAATSLGAEAVVKVLIDSGANVEASGIFGARPLHWAASMGLPLTVERLLKSQAEIEAKCTEFGSTPLYWAVVGFGPNGPNRKIDPIGSARVLIEAGANIATTNIQGVSALEYSRGADSNEMYELLLQHTNGV